MKEFLTITIIGGFIGAIVSHVFHIQSDNALFWAIVIPANLVNVLVMGAIFKGK